MEKTEELNNSVLVSLEAAGLSLRPKQRGRPSKPIDPVKKASFEAALANVEEGVSSTHLAKVTGLPRTEVMNMLKSLMKEGKVVKTGAKKGSRYGNAKF